MRANTGATLSAVLCVCANALFCAHAADAEWSWQKPHSEVLQSGDLKWAPKPFVFEKSDSLRYIDFESGDDGNEGSSKEKPWKHHPWDSAATRNAQACKGIQTYVFKGGVYYRGELKVAESGTPQQPIRLTRDPSWGAGEAVLCGSERVTGWKKGATHKDIPEPEKVWYADVDFAPRSVWLVRKEGDYFRIPLARTPN